MACPNERHRPKACRSPAQRSPGPPVGHLSGHVCAALSLASPSTHAARRNAHRRRHRDGVARRRADG
eukprot:scaffold7209_cov551-Prasinococcus_capsulatus_cf.AAC.1